MKPESSRTWDPGGNHNSGQRNNLVKINIPLHIYSLLATVMVSEVDAVDDDHMEVKESSQSELDSHANMPVVGRHAYVISDTGRIADVNHFTPDYATPCKFQLWTPQSIMIVPKMAKATSS
jgi:hypothetical protein